MKGDRERERGGGIRTCCVMVLGVTDRQTERREGDRVREQERM